MNITKVSYSEGLTINTGNYESRRIDVGAETIVEHDEDPLLSLAFVKQFVKEQLEKER